MTTARLAAATALFLAAGPRMSAAQQIVEYGPQVTATAADEASLTAGGYGALRSLGRTRFAAMAGVGAGEDGGFAWRGELTAHFLLNPRTARGIGAYAGGGAAAADAGDGAHGYLVLLAGIESRPGASSGWAVEAGFGGGVRLSASWRWRRFPPNWRFRR